MAVATISKMEEVALISKAPYWTRMWKMMAGMPKTTKEPVVKMHSLETAVNERSLQETRRRVSVEEKTDAVEDLRLLLLLAVLSTDRLLR